MPRIRNITVAGIFAGATILGGAGLAGATDGETPHADPGLQALEEELFQSSADLSTGEADLTSAEEDGADSDETPTLPDAASDRAGQAVAAAAADPSTEDAEDSGAIETDETHDPAEHDNHGHHVSDTAHTADPGPGHGEAVSSVAREHGEAQRAESTQDEYED